LARKTTEEIKEICKKFNTDRLWSFSRFNCFRTSPYEYYLKYIEHAETDRANCVYGCMGGMAHDILEKFYTGDIKYADIINEFEDSWLTTQIAGLKFDRNNEESNEKIGIKYYDNLKHFFLNYKPLPYKMTNEQFITIKVGKYHFQGYIDAVFKDEDEIVNILDYKTSTIYTGAKIEKESAQLLLYALGLNQMGVPWDKLKICWNFLKYATVDVKQAKGDFNTRNIARNEIGFKLKSSAKMWLKKDGYSEEEIEEYLQLLTEMNNIECLPKSVHDKFIVRDCYVYVDITPEMIERLKTEIISTLDHIVDLEKEFKISKDDKLFWDSDASVEKESYYFATLCDFSAYLHKPYGAYLDRLKAKRDESKGLNNMQDEDLDWLKDL